MQRRIVIAFLCVAATVLAAFYFRVGGGGRFSEQGPQAGTGGVNGVGASGVSKGPDMSGTPVEPVTGESDQLPAEVTESLSEAVSAVPDRDNPEWRVANALRLYKRLSRSSPPQDITEVVDETVFTVFDLWYGMSPRIAYDLCVKAIGELELLGAGKGGSTNLELERLRLVIWKSRIERTLGGLHPLLKIPVSDTPAANREYERLRDLKPTNEMERYVKNALLAAGRDVLVEDGAEVGPLMSVIEEQPAVSNVRDAITVAKIRTWAFVAYAEPMSVLVNQIPEKALHLQYAIDYVGSLPDDVRKGMNDSDRAYLEWLQARARMDLEELARQAETMGVDVAESLEGRVPVGEFRFSRPPRSNP